MTIPADEPGVRRGLNFSGDQWRRAMSVPGSSVGPRRNDDQAHNKRRFREEGNDASPFVSKSIPEEVFAELLAGAQKMGME